MAEVQAVLSADDANDLSDDDIIDELVTWFANRLHVLRGDTKSLFEDLLVDRKRQLVQNDPGQLVPLIAEATDGSWASHRALMELFQRKLLHAPELQNYAASHGKKPRKRGRKHDWSLDNCILSAVSWAVRMRPQRDHPRLKSGLYATRNPNRVKTSDDQDFDDEGTVQSACALVARALQCLGELMLERQPPELVALFGKLTRKDIKRFMLAENTIQRRWEDRPWRSSIR